MTSLAQRVRVLEAALAEPSRKHARRLGKAAKSLERTGEGARSRAGGMGKAARTLETGFPRFLEQVDAVLDALDEELGKRRDDLLALQPAVTGKHARLLAKGLAQIDAHREKAAREGWRHRRAKALGKAAGWIEKLEKRIPGA